MCQDPDLLLNDPNIYVVNNFKWPDVFDLEWEAAEAEYEPISKDGELTVNLRNSMGNGFQVIKIDEEGEGEDA